MRRDKLKSNKRGRNKQRGGHLQELEGKKSNEEVNELSEQDVAKEDRNEEEEKDDEEANKEEANALIDLDVVNKNLIKK